MDDRTFRNAMGQFVTGVTVITSQVEDEIFGMTANAFMSVSLDPKFITVSIANSANMLEKIKQSNQFAVNILSDKQKAVSMHFAGQKNDESVVNFDSVQSVPTINHALVSVICDVYTSYVVGDHTLFIGKVIDIVSEEGAPLTFYSGKYGKNKVEN